MSKTVVILGAGVGGLSCANELRRHLKPEHRVVVIERQSMHLFSPSLLWLMVGDRRREQLTKELRRMLRPDVELINADVQSIDPIAKRVEAGGHVLEFDYLVVALGAELAPDAVPGFTAAHNFFDLDGAAQLREALNGFQGGRVVVAVTALPFKCPAAPYEAALLIEAFLRRRGVRARSEIMIVTPETQPMPVAGPVMGQAVTALLSERGISYAPGRPIRSIDAEKRDLVCADETREHFDLLAGVPPHRAPQVVASSPLANQHGWIPVDRYSMRTPFEGVFAIGDIAAATLANGKPLPKAGVFAHAEALTVAKTLVSEIDGGQPGTFDGLGYCWVELGDGQAAFASGNFYAEPDPTIQLRPPGRGMHLGKVAFEHYWMGNRIERTAAGWMLALGSKVINVPGGM